MIPTAREDPSAAILKIMKDGYKSVATDGLPKEDGSYLLLLLAQEHSPQLFVRFTDLDGAIAWISTDRTQIQEHQILMYKRVLITPEGLK